MVFEHLFPAGLLERKEWSAFFLAAIYSTLSIIIARLLFPANSGIVSVAFLSIFLIPYFETILKREADQEAREASSKRSFLHLLQGNADAIRVYFFLFFGIYLTYMAYAFIAPYFGFDIGVVFREQLSLESIRGGATFSVSTFTSILFNNWWVLLACFIIALVAGDGAVFFIAWNASTWGTIFGYRAIEAGAHGWGSPFLALIVILLVTLPHLLLEAGAYILAAIAGGVISDEVDKPSEMAKFVIYFLSAAMVYVLFVVIMPSFGIVSSIAVILLAFGILYAMRFVFDDRSDVDVFTFNIHLFALSIGVFALGALIETFVLYNATLLRGVYFAAAGFG